MSRDNEAHGDEDDNAREHHWIRPDPDREMEDARDDEVDMLGWVRAHLSAEVRQLLLDAATPESMRKINE